MQPRVLHDHGGLRGDTGQQVEIGLREQNIIVGGAHMNHAVHEQPMNHGRVHAHAAPGGVRRPQRRRQDRAAFAHHLVVKLTGESPHMDQLVVAAQHLARMHAVRLAGVARLAIAQIDGDRLGVAKHVEDALADAVEQLLLIERRRDGLHERIERAQLALGVLQLPQAAGHAFGHRRGVERAGDLGRRFHPDQRQHLDELGGRPRRGRGLLRAVVVEAKAERPEAQDVVGRQALPLDLHVVDEGAVGAVEVVGHVAAGLGRDLAVLPRDARVVEDDVVVGATSDEAGRIQREAATSDFAVEAD